MEKFSTSIKGYRKEEVNNFVNSVVTEVENMLSQLKAKDAEIANLKNELQKYKDIENTLNNAIRMAEDSSSQMRRLAKEESQNIINDARKNASRIVNDALMEAEKTQMDSLRLKRNIVLFKKRLRLILENQLEMVDDIDHLDENHN